MAQSSLHWQNTMHMKRLRKRKINTNVSYVYVYVSLFMYLPYNIGLPHSIKTVERKKKNPNFGQWSVIGVPYCS